MAFSSSLSPTERLFEKSIITGSFFKPEHYLAFCDNDAQAQRLVDCCTNLGLMTFLNPPIHGICYENLIAFWKNAKVVPSTKKTEGDRIISSIFGKEVVITPGVLNRYLHLPRIGPANVKDVEIDIKKFWAEIAKNPRTNSKTYNRPRSMLKPSFATFAPVITKNIEGRKGSMENLTEVRIRLMAIIYEGTNFDWATFVFNRLKDQIHKEINLSRTAPGKGLQKKGDFWERKSYGFPLQHLFNTLKIKPTNLQTPHKSKTMFTYIKASMKPKSYAGSKRKQPEDNQSGVGYRTRSRSASKPQSSKGSASVIISDTSESEEEHTKEEVTYLEEGEEGYRMTTSDEEEIGEEETKEEDSHSEEDHIEADPERVEASDDELTLQEALFRSLSKVDKQVSEPTDNAHPTEPVNTPIIDQGGKASDKEKEYNQEERTEDKQAEREEAGKEEAEEEKKEEKEEENEEEEEDAHEETLPQEEEESKDEEMENSSAGDDDDENINMSPPQIDPDRIFNLDIHPLIMNMERQHSSRRHLKRVLSCEEASINHKLKALYDHIKVQDTIMEQQGNLICNLQHLIPHHVQANLDFLADKIDDTLKPVVRTLNAHTEHIQLSSKDLELLVKVGEANRRILEKQYGPLPDSDNVDADLKALFGAAKKGEGSSKPEVSRRKGKDASSGGKGKEGKGKGGKGKGIRFEEIKK